MAWDFVIICLEWRAPKQQLKARTLLTSLHAGHVDGCNPWQVQNRAGSKPILPTKKIIYRIFQLEHHRQLAQVGFTRRCLKRVIAGCFLQKQLWMEVIAPQGSI